MFFDRYNNIINQFGVNKYFQNLKKLKTKHKCKKIKSCLLLPCSEVLHLPIYQPATWGQLFLSEAL